MIQVIVDSSGKGTIHIDHEDPDELLEHIVVLDEALIKFVEPEKLHKLIDIAVDRDGAEITASGSDMS